ncbi:PSD1 and planctomycete cytochrome C domain-containing protein [Neorhodopirellula pilleata]|nr:PSD1 and planctomycete cytochrome C domain-containing protein [Neorhodopirellula pilleata]
MLHTAVDAPAAEVDFVRDVRPIFQKHCYSCHGETKQKSGLRLDVKSEAFKGGDAYGPSLVAGQADESPVIELVSSDDDNSRMPPEGHPLSTEEILTLRTWVDAGAVWPDGVDLAQLEDRLNHWSLKPIRSPNVPRLSDDDWSRGALDCFIFASLQSHGLAPAPTADVVSWLRRVTLDLTGLPPNPQETTDFVKESRKGESAYVEVVDRLLESPRYGERWGQHWLDVVRYADTHGFEVNTERPNAWPYRDYVIDAFNHDTAYNQFIKQQIVGDAMGADAATGFLVTASVLLPGQIGKDAPSMRLARQDSLDEIVNNISQTFLGLSVGCARCHDHKFDPISAKDYYAMQAFVAGVEYADREIQSPEAEAAKAEAERLQERVSQIDQRLASFVPLARPVSTDDADAEVTSVKQNVPVASKRSSILATINTDRFTPVRTTRLRFTVLATNRLEPCIDELEVFNKAGQNIALASLGTVATTSGDKIVANRHEPRFIHDGKYGNSRSWMSSGVGEGWVELEFETEQEIDRVVWGRDRQGKFNDRLATEYRIEAFVGDAWKLLADSTDREPRTDESSKAPSIWIAGLTPEEAGQASGLLKEKAELEAKIKAAGNGQKVFAGRFRKPDEIHLLRRGDPEQPAEPVVPAVLSAIGELSLPEATVEQTRRQTLADWIACPDNPLTARVMANRIWQWHFGVGLVETANDFGRNGVEPSHPELLDWLAQELIRSDWSIKRMHRLIVLSSTYRQSTQHNADAEMIDADVKLLWRFPSRRLEAEVIRDGMLVASGQLNMRMGGPGFDLFNKRGGLSGFTPVESFAGDGLRRMVYAHKVRRERDAVFGAFDCPDAGQSTPRRVESTTPIQALNLFNSRFTIEQSEAFASRVKDEVGEDVIAQIQQAYEIALNRKPSAEESSDAEPVVRTHGLPTLCRVLFNSNEFLFLP